MPDVEQPSPFILRQFNSYHPLEDLVQTAKAWCSQEACKDYSQWVAVPILHIEEIQKEFIGTAASIGAQIMLNATEGAFTASIAGKMLAAEGSKFVLIGSCYERRLHPDSNSGYAAKILQALQNGLTPVLCVGELSDSDISLESQVKESIASLTSEQLDGLHIAYDPWWINGPSWVTDYANLLINYAAFRDAVCDSVDPAILPSLKLIYPIPLNSPDLAKIISTPAMGEVKAAGYFIR